MTFGNTTTTTWGFGEVKDTTPEYPREDPPQIHYKDCWKIIILTAVSKAPEQVSTNTPPGIDVYKTDWKVSLAKKCECKPRGEKPPELGRKPNMVQVTPGGGGPNYFIAQMYFVEKECDDCDRYVPTGQDTGPYNIQLCEPDWGPSSIGAFSISSPISTGASIYEKRFGQGILQGAVHGMNGSEAAWYGGDSQAQGFTKSCCGK